MKAQQPIIIIRKKVAGHGGHHGGAWKVAYADFVTAMMAFFMVMWLVAAVSKEQRAAMFDVWQTSLHNPDFSEYARLCGGHGVRVTDRSQLDDALRGALAHRGPAMVEVITDPELV